MPYKQNDSDRFDAQGQMIDAQGRLLYTDLSYLYSNQ